MTCTRCPAPVHAVGLCKFHYDKQWRLRVQQGIYAQVDATPARRHLQTLRRRGWTYPLIERQVRLGQVTIARIHDGGVTQLRADKAAEILALPTTWQHTTLAVPMDGTKRRLSALAWQGWSGVAVCRELGLSKSSLWHATCHGRIQARTAAVIAGFYDRHAYKPGPDPKYAVEARTKGAIPAAAWDGDLDDPNNQPADNPNAPQQPGVQLDEVAFLTSWGLTEAQAAKRLGVRPDSIAQARRRRAGYQQEKAA